MIYNDTIRQGATFYRTAPITGHATGDMPDDATIRGAILNIDGTVAANLLCTVLSRTAWTIAINLPRATTATLDPTKKYLISVNYDQGATTDPISDGFITVKRGPAPPA